MGLRTGEQVKALTGHTNIVLDFDIVGKTFSVVVMTVASADSSSES